MILYFSGTGNSRYCAELLADRLQDRCLDSFRFIRDGVAGDFTSATPWVFVSPTYAWQLPRVFVSFVEAARFAGSRQAYFVMTCGSDIGNPTPAIRALCTRKGLDFRGVLPVVMPENYIALFPVPTPDKARLLVEKARPRLRRAAARIAAGRPFPARHTTLLDALKSGPVNRAFYRFQVRARAFTVSDACRSCGRCAALCPLGNIRLQGGRPLWGDSCTHCMACICGCPAHAIEYGHASQGKPRYQCPAYRG